MSDDDDVCPECNARGTDKIEGITYCINGHQLTGQEVGEDDDEYYQRGKKVSRPKEKVSEKKISKVYHGRKALRLFLQAYQFIIWQQCYALIHNKNLPPELWTIVRDLWTLRLAKLAPRLGKPDEETKDGVARKSKASSSTTAGMPGSKKTRRKTVTEVPRLIESVSLCYLGVLLLRLNISLGDIYRWVSGGDLIYHRAINSVPIEMRQKLPGEYREALDTSILLKPTDLHKVVDDLVILYSTELGMTFPALNSSLLLFKYLRHVALPIEIYPAVERLQRILKTSFSYSSTPNRRHHEDKLYPEIRLMALLVVAVKLFYPFNASRQWSPSLEEPAAQSIDWPRWIKMHKEPNKDGDNVQSGHVRNFEISEEDALGMTGNEIDRYMDWYQRTWAKTSLEAEGARKEILNLFPLSRLNPEPPRASTEQDYENKVATNLVRSQSLLVNNAAITEERSESQDDEISRPGSSYKNWRTEEDVSPSAKAFMSIAAETIGVSIDALLLGVVHAERSIAKWKDRERRRIEFPDESDEPEKLPENAVGDAVDNIARMNIDGEMGDDMAVD